MHIPDGYLSPQTYVPLAGLFIGSAALAVRKVRKELTARHVPFLGMAAAFSFIIMMFNLPVPGGTTGHAVGSAVVSIIFGPWASVIAISVALIIQALLFGDGGITALGANCFNMAVVMSFVAYYIFRWINGKINQGKRIYFSAFAAGYISLLAGALLTALQLGIQPLIAQTAEGTPLYCPYDLSVAIPAMALEHMLLFCVLEGIVTATIIKYFVAKEPDMVLALKKGGKNG